MEREAIVEQITAELLAEGNPYHDARGRFSSKDQAGGGVRDLTPSMGRGLRAGQTARIAGNVRVNGKVLKDAVIGKAPNGNRYIRGVDERGKVRHVNLGVEGKTKVGAPRKARPSEQASVAKAQQQARPLPRDRWNNVQVQKPAQPLQPEPAKMKPVTPPIPMAGPVQVQPAQPTQGDHGDSPLLKSPVVAQKKLGGGINESHVITLADGTKAVWKPIGRVHHPGDVAAREAAAHDVSKVLGMEHLVPETVVRQIDNAVGSVQRFVHDAKNAGHLATDTERYDGNDDLARGAAFDALIGNNDRHDYNWMVSRDGKIHLIDHGFAFSARRFKVGPSHCFLLDQAGRRDLSTELVHREWQNKWPNIESVLQKRGVSPGEISGIKERYHDIMGAASFKTLHQKFIW